MDTEAATCYRHPDRTGLRCQRCDRVVCPDCRVQAPVGFQCAECVKANQQKVYRPRDLVQSPQLTYVLVAINALAYLPNFAGSSSRYTFDYALIGAAMTRFGEIGVAAGEWYRLVTGGFLHASLLHIGFNMLLLLQLGTILEPWLGRVRFGLLFATSMLAGSFGVLLLEPNQFTVGASGAVFGLMGATFMAQRSRGVNAFQAGGLGGLIIINLLITFVVPRVSMGAHVGGLIGGGLAGLFLVWAERRLPVAAQAGVLAAASAVLVAGSLWAAGQPGLLDSVG
ncbi:MAG: rhomboid family intramembrane serine protease [Actinomycetota bacterium]|nr:rhomboid family intramembrane serine protease [Actinomycetota bacterium]